MCTSSSSSLALDLMLFNLNLENRSPKCLKSYTPGSHVISAKKNRKTTYLFKEIWTPIACYKMVDKKTHKLNSSSKHWAQVLKNLAFFLLQVIIVTTAVWVLTTNCFWTKPYIERLPQRSEHCNICFRTSWSLSLIVLTSWNTTDILKVELSIFPITTYCYKYSPLSNNVLKSNI